MLLFWGVTAVLYALLMPLWEGFDEPFHYAYGQWLATERTLPVLGTTPLSQEIHRSLELAPASHVVKRNLPFVTTFSDYRRLGGEERRARRERLESIAGELRLAHAAGTSNYEAQQAPLSYLPVAVAEALGSWLPLPSRVLMVRLLCALTGGALQLWWTYGLARELGIGRRWLPLTLYLVCGVQMFHATFSRVSNDWLAVPLATLVLLQAVRFHRRPEPRQAALLGLAIALGLLAKAYLVAWALFGVLLVAGNLMARRAGWKVALASAAGLLPAVPWYARNFVLYGNLMGTTQALAGVGPARVWQAALDIPWLRTLPMAARAALWTGNNSFTSFSAGTLNLVLLLGGLALLAWAAGSRRSPDRVVEWLAAGGAGLFVASLLYANAMFVAFVPTAYYTATPWYAQALAAPVACLAVLGMERLGLAGRWLAGMLAMLIGYLMVATFWLKLIPLCSGCEAPRMGPAALLSCYSGDWLEVLPELALGDANVVVGLAVASSLLAAVCALLSIRTAIGSRDGGSL